MDIMRIQANVRKFQYATEAMENHDCTGNGCERCQNADTSAAEALEALPKWLVRISFVMASIVYIVTWPFYQLQYLWHKLFHKLFHKHEEE